MQDLAAWEQDAYLAAVRAQVEAWTAEDDIRWSVPVEQVVRLLIATADGIGSAWLADRDDAAAEATVLVAARAIASLADGSGA